MQVADIDRCLPCLYSNQNPARRFLEDLRVPAGEWLLHNGASSVLGRELVAMAKRRGTQLINVVRRREAVSELKGLGCAPLSRWVACMIEEAYLP